MDFDENMFETLMDSLQEGVYFVNTLRTIQYWNKGAENLTGYSRADVLGKCCASNILAHIDGEGDGLCTGKCPLQEAITDGKPRHTEAYRNRIQVTVSTRSRPDYRR